jgi:hypothetical protein
MGASKNLLMLMQEQELSNAFPSKKEIQINAKKFVSEILESGNVDKTELFTQAVRINEALAIVTESLKNMMPLENFEAFGIKGTYRNGGDTLNYKEDPIYLDIQKELKEREELLKVAYKSSNEIYDEGGVLVPKVSSTPRKSSLTINY